MLTRPEKSETEDRCYKAEATRKLWDRGQILWGWGQWCRTSYKNTIYECLRSNIKIFNTKKSHPVRQSQQCQYTSLFKS